MSPQAAQPIPLHFYAHRSGAEAWQYCPRRRFLQYHHLGTGIGIYPPIYFEVGTAVHGTDPGKDFQHESDTIQIERAGLAALMELSKTQAPVEADMQAFVKNALAMYHRTPVYQTQRPDERSEQDTLIAGLLWSFWFRVWPLFAQKFEVLMVEAASVDTREFEITHENGDVSPAKLHLLSRPDVIVRDRQTHEIVAINWKTINSITDERRQNIASSLQVNLEAFYAEKLYSKWVDEEFIPPAPPAELRGKKLMEWYEQAGEYYKTLPRVVAYTQIIYLVKGARQLLLADGSEVLTEQEGDLRDVEKFWRQDSFLCYRWIDLTGGMGQVDDPDAPSALEAPVGGKTRRKKPAAPSGLPLTSWSYRYYKSGNKSYNQLNKNYARQGIWEADDLDSDTTRLPSAEGQIKAWVQLLNAGKVFPSTHSNEDDRNKSNPLDSLVFFENPIYRDVQLQKELVTSTLVDEMKIAEALVRVWDSQIVQGDDNPFDLEPLDDVLTREFPKRLISCRKPTRCEYDGRICNTPVDKREPLFQIIPTGSAWRQRVPHHAAEWEAFQNDRA